MVIAFIIALILVGGVAYSVGWYAGWEARVQQEKWRYR